MNYQEVKKIPFLIFRTLTIIFLSFLNTRLVEDEILFILRSRFEHCAFYHGEDVHLCDDLRKTYDDAATAWFMKCKHILYSRKKLIIPSL